MQAAVAAGRTAGSREQLVGDCVADDLALKDATEARIKAETCRCGPWRVTAVTAGLSTCHQTLEHDLLASDLCLLHSTAEVCKISAVLCLI
jgi:hypothetical protein